MERASSWATGLDAGAGESTERPLRLARASFLGRNDCDHPVPGLQRLTPRELRVAGGRLADRCARGGAPDRDGVVAYSVDFRRWVPPTAFRSRPALQRLERVVRRIRSLGSERVSLRIRP